MPADALQHRDEGHEGVWPEHVPAVEAFLAIGDQWDILQITSPMGAPGLHYRGLDPLRAEASLRLAGIEMTPKLWAEVRAIEQGARDALNAH
ncbi:DUF1799 domain-containing protein [Sagittula sp. M10.9X]|uniref:DUF1799 domain-containing protein n=1 Tax=Sagittula salina TaxID=2820268 RepID=A0A940MRA1_9RHOB|nr:DUF1799 domain-containing protein [Sagittula salina]MBP0483939.1 DUF1799 domain-containing protein [Sagittula salina]